MQLPRARQDYARAAWYWRALWGTRPNALRHARAIRVDADVEASIRNYAQVTRTVFYALLFTAALTGINSVMLRRTFDLQTTWAAFALAMSQVGAFFALRRSNETRAYLGDVRLALHELTARSVLTSAVVYPRALDACRTVAELRVRATEILRHLMDSRLFPHAVDAFSVWARDDKSSTWRIVAAVGASQRTIDDFRQPIIREPTDGAGIVANLAVTADAGASYYQTSAATAPNKWIKVDPYSLNATETVAVFLLPDEESVPIGAFALTSANQDALELEEDHLPERLTLIVDQCAVTLLGVARRAHELFTET
jgi:hypothetical protein